jgi:hypothetical protein
MARLSIIGILSLVMTLCAFATAEAQTFDIGSGGQPTITGASGGSVTGSSSLLNDLTVTINFGEISPANANSIVYVVVPIGIRSTQPYQVTVTRTGPSNANAQALQPADVGFGVNNLQAMGGNSQVCSNSNHIFYSPFNNNPSSTVTIAANGRASYQSSLSDISGSTVILSGPRLTKTAQARRRTDNGYVFNAMFAITPQFFAAGTSSATLTFTISAGPNVPC